MAKEGVEVRGISELFSGSREITNQIPRKDQAEFVKIARARAAMIAAQMPRKTGRMASEVKGTYGEKSMARVGGWTTRVPYLGWMEFGGTRGRPFVPEGRWIYPTALAANDQLQRKGIEVAIRQIRGFKWKTPR